MGKNTQTHPNNAYVVNAQLDADTYHVFKEMRIAAGLNTTDALKALIYRAVWDYSSQLNDVKKAAAKNAFDGKRLYGGKAIMTDPEI